MIQTRPGTQVIGIGQLPKITSILKDQKFLGFDTEAIGKNPRHDKIIAMQFGTKDQCYILDCRPLHEMTDHEKIFWFEAIDDLLHSGPTFVGQNLKYDWQMLFQSFGGVQLDFTVDTMLQEQVIHGVAWGNSGISLSLLGIGTRYEIPVHKEEVVWFVNLDKPRKFYESGHYSFEADGKECWFNADGNYCEEKPEDPGELLRESLEQWYEPFPEAQIAYMRQDVVVPLKIHDIQTWKLRQAELLKAAEIENEALPAFAFMEYCGCLVDIPRWKEIIDILSAEHEQLQNELQEELSVYIRESRRKRYDIAKEEYAVWRELRDILDEQATQEYVGKHARGEFTSVRQEVMDYSVYADHVYKEWLRDNPKPRKIKKLLENFSIWEEASNTFIASIPFEYDWLVKRGELPLYELQEITCDKRQYIKNVREAWYVEHPEPRHATPAEERRIEEPINLGAWQQLLEAFRAIGIIVPDTKAKTLEEYIDRPVVKKLLRWKDLQKFKTTYGYPMLAKVDMLDGRMHASFAMIGAATGRTSSYNPNFQNIPKEEEGLEHLSLRRCFIAPKGSKLLTCDYPAIEVRILAELSGDVALLKAFEMGIDIHSAIARIMFHLPEDVNPKYAYLVPGVSYRNMAKTIIFGLSYGMGAGGLAARLGTTKEVAEAALQTFKTTYETAMSYLNETANNALRDGCSRTPSGRIRYYEKLKKPYYGGVTDEDWEEYRNTPDYIDYRRKRGNISREAKNHPIQGACADMIKKAMSYLYKELPTGAKIVGTVHDEILCEVEDALVDETKKILDDCMLRAARFYLKKVAFPKDKKGEKETLDVSVAQYWSK